MHLAGSSCCCRASGCTVCRCLGTGHTCPFCCCWRLMMCDTVWLRWWPIAVKAEATSASNCIHQDQKGSISPQWRSVTRLQLTDLVGQQSLLLEQLDSSNPDGHQLAKCMMCIV